MTEVMFFFCHKGIISTIGIMHICMLGKEVFFFYHLHVESPCGMKKSFPLFFIFVVVIVAVISLKNPYLHSNEKYMQLKST